MSNDFFENFCPFVSSVPSADLTDLTLIIPTFGRPTFLLRQIAYLSKWKTHVLIVDGSETPLPREILMLLEEFPHINYLHCHAGIFDRISLACEKIATPYAMLLADDDLYLQSGLVSAIERLKSDTNAIACIGQSLGLDIFNHDYYLFRYGSSLSGYVIDDVSAEKRITNGFNLYRSATPYAVFKTYAFLKVWEKTDGGIHVGVSCPEFIEYEHAIRTYLCGRLISTPDVFWLRSFETLPIANQFDGDRRLDFAKWYRDTKFKQETETVKSRILELFMTDGLLNKIRAEALYDLVIQSILSNSHSSLCDKSTTIGVVEKLLAIANAAFPHGLKRVKRTFIWQVVRTSVLYISREKFVERRDGREVDKKELSEVLEFINKFSKSLDPAIRPYKNVEQK